MRTIVFLIILAYSQITTAVDWEERELFESLAGTETLRIISTTDTSVFAPLIELFQTSNPHVDIEYFVASSTDTYQAVEQTLEPFDVVISSAMDLQLKLVNDGHAKQLQNLQHPDWAQWRQSLFGFTLEPAAIVINRAAFSTLPVPRSRQDMLEVLRENPDVFTGRVGTYDVRRSGLGYLFATQDARRAETYWRLMEIMGSLDARVYCCSGEMIEDLASGDIAISYNVLGSYATLRKDVADKIEIILPSEFPTTMMRTAFVVTNSAHPRLAETFLRFLTSSQWSSGDTNAVSLPSIHDSTGDSQRSVISLEPGLMVFLDRMKRKRFLKDWESALIQ